MKRIYLVLALLLTTIFISNVIYAGTLSEKKLGIVAEVIDGEALVVKFNNTEAYFKLIGVDTSASMEALKYVNTYVKGKHVWVVTEDFANAEGSSKYYMAYIYMYDNGKLLNDTLIREGLAKLKTTDSFAFLYDDLAVAQNYAKSKKIGLWQVNSKSYSYFGDGVNINTASSSQLTTLKDITSSLATNIINYRKENPFNTIQEIKFVKGITKEIYDNICSEIVVSTNINTASEEQLLTLSSLTKSDVRSIIDYRNESNNGFTRLEDFYKKTDLTQRKYDDNLPFISLDYEESIDYRTPNKVVNINTASSSQIKSISGSLISTSDADKIVSNRKNGYSYKTLMELTNITSMSIETIHKLEDNFVLYTDINNADTDELRSLFGNDYITSEINKIKDQRPFRTKERVEDIIGSTKYDKIKDFIYVGDYKDIDKININLSTEEQLKKLDLSSNQISRLKDKSRKMKKADDLPFSVKDIDSKISLYTNINTASEKELEAIYNMSNILVNAIVLYRDEQPFGSLTEIEQFFKDQNQRSIYDYIKDFIVVR